MLVRLLLQTLILINHITYSDQLLPLIMKPCRAPYLRPSWTSTMEFLWKILNGSLTSQMFDLVLNTPLSHIFYSAIFDLTLPQLFIWISITVYSEDKYSQCQTFSPKKYEAGHINSFQVSDTFLYYLRT